MPALGSVTLAATKSATVQTHVPAKVGSETSSRDIHVGFSGHFACKAFSGPDRKLCAYVSGQDERKARWAIQDGANVNARAHGLVPRGMTMLQVAIWYHWSLRSITILLDCGADVNARDDAGDTPLIYATRDPSRGNLAGVKRLLQHGADVNAQGMHGMTPLMVAALYSSSIDVLSTLIKADADVHATDHRGWTALMQAARSRRNAAEKVKILLAAGGEVNRTHRHGGTALMIACLQGNTACAKALLGAGAQINHADEAGWTPLLCATMSGDVTLVDLLLNSGADPHHADRLGRTPRVLAERAGHAAIANRLRRPARPHDATPNRDAAAQPQRAMHCDVPEPSSS